MDVNFAEYRRQYDTDILPMTPVVVFSSNMPIPERDFLNFIVGEGSWKREREPAYVVDAEDAWRIWPYVGDQTALLYLDRRNVGTAARIAYLLERGEPGMKRLGVWWDATYAPDPDADYSLFCGRRYQILADEEDRFSDEE